MKSQRFLVILMFVGVMIVTLHTSYGQNTKRDVIQFTGIVTTVDTTSGIMGAHIFVPKEGRGTTTNYYGYFSFPVLEGDSVVVSAVGFQRIHFTIPEIDKDSYSVLITLPEDTTYLPELEVRPFPTEEMFKEAVLAYRLPNQGDINNMDSNLDPYLLMEMAKNMPMDGSMNHRYFTQQRAEYLFDGNGPRYNPLFNPFAWAQFFDSIKKKKK